MAIKRNISGVEYDVVSPSYYVHREPGMSILLMYNGYGEWVTYVNREPVGLDQSLQAAADAIAVGLHGHISKSVQRRGERMCDMETYYRGDTSKCEVLVTVPPDAS